MREVSAELLSDRSRIEQEMAISLHAATEAELFVVRVMGGPVCWLRVHLKRGDLHRFAEQNGWQAKLVPVSSDSAVLKYENPGVEGHRPPQHAEWIASGFRPAYEYRGPHQQFILGSVPEGDVAYATGCPRDTNVVFPQ